LGNNLVWEQKSIVLGGVGGNKTKITDVKTQGA